MGAEIFREVKSDPEKNKLQREGKVDSACLSLSLGLSFLMFKLEMLTVLPS